MINMDQIEILPTEMIVEVIKKIGSTKSRDNLMCTSRFFRNEVKNINKQLLDSIKKMSMHSLHILCSYNEDISLFVLKNEPSLLGRYKEDTLRSIEEVYCHPHWRPTYPHITGELLFNICRRFESCRELAFNSEKVSSCLSEDHKVRLMSKPKSVRCLQYA